MKGVQYNIFDDLSFESKDRNKDICRKGKAKNRAGGGEKVREAISWEIKKIFQKKKNVE